VGANYNWTPAGHVTLSSEAGSGGTSQSAVNGAKRVVDAYALWTFSPAVQLRLSGANLLAQDNLSSSSVATSTATSTRTSLARTTAETWQVWSLRLELKL
jgi:iron complex outermembrane receptor protein